MASDELTPKQVADEFGVSTPTVRRWEESGLLAPTRRLPGSRHRRYSRADVDAFKASQETAAGNPPSAAPPPAPEASAKTPPKKQPKKPAKPEK